MPAEPFPITASRRGSASTPGLLLGLALLLLAGAVVDGERVRRQTVNERAERIQAREFSHGAAALPIDEPLCIAGWRISRDATGTVRVTGPRHELVRDPDGRERWSRRAQEDQP